jgi:Sigma-70 region 2
MHRVEAAAARHELLEKGANLEFVKKNGRAGHSNTSIGKIVSRETETALAMPGESSRQVLRQLKTLFHCGVAGPLSHEELLQQFVARTEESAETAFTALVDRHGAMVLGGCRHVLRNHQAAEDAFQATFLLLVRKASQTVRREQLASWLFGGARRWTPVSELPVSMPSRNGSALCKR